MSNLSQERLKSLLSYDPETGRFTWAARVGNRTAGVAANNINEGGYRCIRVDGHLYRAHRLAWLWMTGAWPSDRIDHINGLPSDNRWCNLREATHALNLQNQRRARSDNSTGFLGVKQARNKFQARISVSGKPLHLGSFSTPELAHAAYVDAKRRLHAGCTI